MNSDYGLIYIKQKSVVSGVCLLSNVRANTDCQDKPSSKYEEANQNCPHGSKDSSKPFPALKAKPEECMLFMTKYFDAGMNNEFFTNEIPCPTNIKDRLVETDQLTAVTNFTIYYATTGFLGDSKSSLMFAIHKGVLDNNPGIEQGEKTGYPVEECGICKADIFPNKWILFRCHSVDLKTECPEPIKKDIRFWPPEPAFINREVSYEYCYYTESNNDPRYLCHFYFVYKDLV
ncbi:uncharacterized protein [Ptychodera flava]|uniref:uncharacterized protein isoform X2 n=1 Tax=Ptychodera flava TaxID=63121 RepID=UPI00396A7894